MSSSNPNASSSSSSSVRRPWNAINSVATHSLKRRRSARLRNRSPNGTQSATTSDNELVPSTSDTRPRKRGGNSLPVLAGEERNQPDVFLSLDFGTTRTSVAASKPGLDEIILIQNFPDDPSLDCYGNPIPSESCYRKLRPGQTNRRRETGARLRKTASRDSANDDPLHGFQVQNFLRRSKGRRSSYETVIPVRHMKLLLYKNKHGEALKEELRETLRQLKDHGFIEKDEDVICNYLTSIFGHCKSELQRIGWLKDNTNVEVSAGVPVCWNVKANAAYTKCIIEAMNRATFGVNGRVPNIFLVNEGEAAAIHALDSAKEFILCDKTFILVDCGGGTTDTGSFRVSKDYPLRINEEVNRALGSHIGATDLDARMRNLVTEDLRPQLANLSQNDPNLSIENIVDNEIMPIFDREYKRNFVLDNKDREYDFWIRGLEPSGSNPRIQRGRYVLTYDDMFRIFETVLRRIAALVRELIEYCVHEGLDMEKVVLAGGFSDSPALQTWIRNMIIDLTQEFARPIQLIIPTQPTHGAIGVVMGINYRARNKAFGPKRELYQSFGIIRHQRYKKGTKKEWMNTQKPHPSEFDKVDEIRDTIEWRLKAQRKVKPYHSVKFRSSHCFRPEDDVWKASERLFVSREDMEDYWRVDHPKNAGVAEELGTIEFDLTPLKPSTRLIRVPTEIDGKDYYKVTVQIEMVVFDRNLTCAVHCKNGTRARKDMSIAAAFRPGTK